MSTDASTPENEANLSGLGRALLESKDGSKPSGPWVPPTAEELGRLLPEYEIVKMLGRGGMGAVYMGRQKSLDRPVAIKILSTALEDADPSFAERFKNEARAMGKLNHPGIVSVHDFGEAEGGLLYIVMEYVEGTDVARMIAKEGRLHTEHAMAITAHVCDALAYAHERGIIHRDIKPANIMVGYDGVVKVADFGLAKMTHSNATGLTQSGMAMGTLHYMAPEALMLGSAVDHRADIYAVGVMLYQMLTGKIPQGMFKLPSLQIPGLDPRYDAIIAKGIMEDREARYQSVGEMRGDLDAILTQPVVKVEAEVSQAPAALPTMARPQRPGAKLYRPQQPAMQPAAKKSGGWLIWAVLGVFALGGCFMWMNRNSPAQQTSTNEPPAPAPINAATPSPVVSTVSIPSTPVSTALVTPTVIPSSSKAAVVRTPWPAGPNFQLEGRFRAWSSLSNDSKLDLTKLQGVDDAAQVYVNSNGWLVLRRTGDVISNLSGADGLKGIKRVCRGDADDFALITRAGSVIPFPQRTDPANRIPDGLGPVKDVYISSFRQAAILEDGSLVTWGTAHDGIDTPGNGEWKDKPVLPPGRKAVAMSNTIAAMGLRTDDGKILRWGDNGGFGRSQSKFDADPETPFLMNGMALYAVPKTDGPVLVANWRGNDPATPFADDIRGRDFIPANNGGKHVVLLDRDGRLALDPMCVDRSITAALDFVTLAERDLVTVHFSDKGQPVTRFLWFDKASPSSPASSPGASPPASDPLLAIPDFRTRVANYQKARYAQLSALATKYRSALTTEKDAATKSGVLAAVTTCDAALAGITTYSQLIEANLTATEVKPLPAPAEVPDNAPPRLKELQGIFGSGVAKIETTLVGGLDSSLATVQASLQQAAKITEAKAVETYRQQLMAAFKTTPASASVSMAAASPPADLPAQTRIVQRLVAIQNVCAWPNLTLMPDGSVIAIVFNQPNHGVTPGDLDCYASNDGLNWEKRGAVTAHEPDTIRMNHAAGLAGNGDLIVLCSGWTNLKQPQRPKQQPFRDAVLRSWVLRSKDGGRSWSKNDVFPTAESADWSDYVPFGDIWKAQEGTLRASCYQEHYVNPTQSIKSNGLRAWCFRSDDDGATWKPQALISPTHSETNLFPLGGKSWLAAARDVQVDLIRSDDDGATWSQPTPATVRGEVNGHLTRLADKRLLLSYGVRSRGSQGVSAKLSSDEGRTWSPPIRLVDSLDSDCGYPSSVQLANGRIVTAYYSKRSSDYNGYHMGVAVWEPGRASSASSMPAPPQPAPNAASQTPAISLPQATKDKPFVNSLGMKFVPVKITGGQTDGKTIFFSVWETRVQDYAVYEKDSGRKAVDPSFQQKPDHPKVMVSWEDANGFCEWLTRRERQNGALTASKRFRLPTDHEWSCAVGIGGRENADMLPSEKAGKLGLTFPWGTDWPPTKVVGNFAGEEFRPAYESGQYSDWARGIIGGWRDGFVETSPVGSFPPNEAGLYDLSGNVWEWCEDWHDSLKTDRVFRGGSWVNYASGGLSSAARGYRKPMTYFYIVGFRVVLEVP